MAEVSLKAVLFLGLLCQATCQYCEGCRGVMTPFCSLSCSCDMCEGDVGERLYGQWNCNGCNGKLTPWCGRWCWCHSCEKVSGVLELAASDHTEQGAPAWGLVLQIAMSGSFTGVLVWSCLRIWKHATCNTAWQTPLLSSSQLDDSPPTLAQDSTAT